MEFVWAPWRIEYILGEKDKDCIFCAKPRQNRDRENLILFRGQYNLVMLNKYPYNPGHLMVAPYRHLSGLHPLRTEEMLEHFQLVSRCVDLLRAEMNPDGMNVGINLGKPAGAGIEEHIHTHIVPRWNGDTNFMTVLSDVRVVPEALLATYDKLFGKLPG